MAESYESDVAEYLDDHPDASGAEIADAVGCSNHTAVKWMKRLQGSDEPSDEPPESGDDLGPDDLGDGDGQQTLEGEPAEQVESDGESGDGEQADLGDDESKTYECGGCGASLDYLQKQCDECGARPAWSKIDS